ncbi:hypothetical protein MRX96_042508, partial [Rhipicephalus microplus]
MNALGENTLENIVPLLTGQFLQEVKNSCRQSEDQFWDNCTFLWTTSFEHGCGREQSLYWGGHLNKTVVVLLSDHGMRWGSIRQTVIGLLEGRLPGYLWYLPRSLTRRHPHLLRALKKNGHRLTMPFDVQATLRGVLEDFKLPDTSSTKRFMVAKAVVRDINRILKPYAQRCAILSLQRIESAYVHTIVDPKRQRKPSSQTGGCERDGSSTFLTSLRSKKATLTALMVISVVAAFTVGPDLRLKIMPASDGEKRFAIFTKSCVVPDYGPWHASVLPYVSTTRPINCTNYPAYSYTE